MSSLEVVDPVRKLWRRRRKAQGLKLFSRVWVPPQARRLFAKA